MTNTKAAVELKRISKVHLGHGKPVRALSDISLRVKSGEHLAVVGPSGSGKSSLLSIIGCLDVPDEGLYKLFGREITTLGATELAAVRSERIGFVFQSMSLLPNLNVFANVGLPFDYSIASDDFALAAIRDALSKVGMLSYGMRMPRELSGGQQQRVAIARAIVKNPDLILADEPTGALDQAAAHEIMDAIDGLRDCGRTVVTVTHDESISRRADRIAFFSDGRFSL